MISMPLLLCAALPAADVPTKADIAAAWQRRVEALPYVEIQGKVIRTTDRAVDAEVWKEDRKSFKGKRHAQAEDSSLRSGSAVFERSLHVRFGPEGRLYIDSDIPVYNLETGDYIKQRQLYAHRQGKVKMYRVNSARRYPKGNIGPVDLFPEVPGHDNPFVIGWMIQVRPFHASTLLSPELNEFQNVIRDPGRPEFVIASESALNGTLLIEYVLDPRRDFLPVEIITKDVDANHRMMRKIHFSDPIEVAGRWFFQRWTTTIFLTSSTQIRYVEDGTLDTIRVEPLDDDQFDFDFPTNTTIFDREKKQWHFVDKDGRWVPVTDQQVSQSLATGELPAGVENGGNSTRSKLTRILWWFGGGLLLAGGMVALVALLVRRRRTDTSD